jgi:hypothetical protein
MGPGQPGNQPPANPTTAIVGGALALLALVLTIVLRVSPLGLHSGGMHFAFHGRFLFDLPGHIIVIAALGAGGVMLLLKKFPGNIIAIVGAVLDIALTLFFVGGFLRLGVWVVDLATIVVCVLPGTVRALNRPAAAQPFVPMGAPGQFGPPPGQPMPSQPMPGQPMQGQSMPGQPMQGQPMQGQPMPGQPIQGQPIPGQPMPSQPMPGQPMPPQQFQQQPGFPAQQPPMPPQQPPPQGYPQQQFPPPPPGQ